MYIRQTQTASKSTGEAYITYRLVRGDRVGGKVRQITLLNLGRNFAFPKEQWSSLCARIEQLVGGQNLAFAEMELPPKLEKAAQHYAGRLVMQTHAPVAEPMAEPVYSAVDVDSLELVQPRSVGVEQVGLHALAQLGLVHKLTALGLNGVMRAAIMGSIIGRMAKPASERATCTWLREHSALGELIHTDFEAMPAMRLYRASDALVKHREAIEQHIFEQVRSLFGLCHSV